MRWFWQRKKRDTPQPTAAEPAPIRSTRVTSPRPANRTGPLAGAEEPRDALLAFARDLLNAQGARVRVEEDDLVIALFPDTPPARYSTTLSRARAEEETILLTQGAQALESLFEAAEQHARLSGLTLSAITDPGSLALDALARPGATCGRCSGDTRGRPVSLTPACDTCPLREGGMALTWESQPVQARILRWEEETSVELSYRISGRDRRGRRDEWLRLAYNPATGVQLPIVSAERLATAIALTGENSGVSATKAATLATAALEPGAQALSAYLAQRVSGEYLRRVEDLKNTHERLKRERPQDVTLLATSLDRDLASLADVYGVEVEAALESVCLIASPLAVVSVEMESGAGATVVVDAGRGAVRPPQCVRCGAPVGSGRVCAQGHVHCATCAYACSHCGELACGVCGETQPTPCALCGAGTCATCARACDACGDAFCPNHVWTCAEGDRALCINDLILCAECQTPLCQEHATTCGACGQRLCARHRRVCGAGGETLCSTHATRCVTCHKSLCDAHTLRCEECEQPVCSSDANTCAGCGRLLCACANMTPCASCGGLYCGRCHAGAPACPACRALAPAGEADLALLRVAAEREPAISLRHTWMTGQNALARVFVSRGLGREEAFLISEDGDVIGAHRKGWRAR
jgi:hypothetical protein